MLLKNVLSQETLAKDAAIPQGGWKLLFWLIAIEMAVESFVRYYQSGRPMSTPEIIVLGLLFLGYIGMNARTGRVLWPLHWLREYIARNVIGRTARCLYGTHHGFRLHSIVERSRRALPSCDQDDKETYIVFLLPLGGWFRGWGQVFFSSGSRNSVWPAWVECRIRRIDDDAYLTLRDSKGCRVLLTPENAGNLLLRYMQSDYAARTVSTHMNGGFTLNAAIAVAMDSYSVQKKYAPLTLKLDK